MTVAHIVLRYVLPGHNVTYYAVEEQQCGVLEERSEGGCPPDLLIVIHIEHDLQVGDPVELAIRGSGDGHYLRSDAVRYLGRLYDGRCPRRCVSGREHGFG